MTSYVTVIAIKSHNMKKNIKGSRTNDVII